MIAEIISVGTEILMGNIVNTNAAYLSEKCAELGLSMYNQQVVGDNAQRLTDALKEAAERSDIVILTGGLGPTQDDMTKEVAAQVCGCELVEDEHSRKLIEAMISKNIFKKIPENNWKQSMVPQGSIVIDNDNGTAPGIIIVKNGKHFILLPGPPNEMIPMFEKSISPYLNELNPGIIYSKMVKICGVGESQAELDIIDLIEKQTNPTIATYAKTGEVSIRVTAKAENLDVAKNLVKPVVTEIKNRFKENVFTTDEEDTLESVVVNMIKKKGLQLITAESCTGGLLAGRIINVSGASEILQQGFITYSNKSKRKVLDVAKSTLRKYGAVSKETAKEMAKGAIFATDADISVAVTGIAGPDTEDNKPVGLVYISCYYSNKVTVKEYQFKGNRQKIREQAVTKALDLVRRCLLE